MNDGRLLKDNRKEVKLKEMIIPFVKIVLLERRIPEGRGSRGSGHPFMFSTTFFLLVTLWNLTPTLCIESWNRPYSLFIDHGKSLLGCEWDIGELSVIWFASFHVK